MYTIPALVALLVGHDGHDGHNDNKGQYHHHHNWNHNVKLVRIPCMYTHTCKTTLACVLEDNLDQKIQFRERDQLYASSSGILWTSCDLSIVSHDPLYCLTWSQLLPHMIPSIYPSSCLTEIPATYPSPSYPTSSLAIYPLHGHSHYDLSWILDYIAGWYYPYWLIRTQVPKHDIADRLLLKWWCW